MNIVYLGHVIACQGLEQFLRRHGAPCYLCATFCPHAACAAAVVFLCHQTVTRVDLLSDALRVQMCENRSGWLCLYFCTCVVLLVLLSYYMCCCRIYGVTRKTPCLLLGCVREASELRISQLERSKRRLLAIEGIWVLKRIWRTFASRILLVLSIMSEDIFLKSKSHNSCITWWFQLHMLFEVMNTHVLVDFSDSWLLRMYNPEIGCSAV